MSATTEFVIGSAVACTDRICGQLVRVVVDPIACSLAHLVVEPKHHRVLPAGLNEAASAGLPEDDSAGLHEDANRRRPMTAGTDPGFAVK